MESSSNPESASSPASVQASDTTIGQLQQPIHDNEKPSFQPAAVDIDLWSRSIGWEESPFIRQPESTLPATQPPAQDTAAQDTAAQDTAAQDTAAQDTAAQDTAAQDTGDETKPPAQDTGEDKFHLAVDEFELWSRAIGWTELPLSATEDPNKPGILQSLNKNASVSSPAGVHDSHPWSGATGRMQNKFAPKSAPLVAGQTSAMAKALPSAQGPEQVTLSAFASTVTLSDSSDVAHLETGYSIEACSLSHYFATVFHLIMFISSNLG